MVHSRSREGPDNGSSPFPTQFFHSGKGHPCTRSDTLYNLQTMTGTDPHTDNGVVKSVSHGTSYKTHIFSLPKKFLYKGLIGTLLCLDVIFGSHDKPT